VTALLTTNLGETLLLGRGKVRDLYAVPYDGRDALLLVATDRISAFDHVLATGIPGKGKILTQISLFWFDLMSELIPNHLITAEVSEFPAALQPYADQLEGRSMLVKRARMFPVECVARGYLTGSGLKEYKVSGSVCGIPLPDGLWTAPGCRSRYILHPPRARPAHTMRTSVLPLLLQRWARPTQRSCSG